MNDKMSYDIIKWTYGEVSVLSEKEDWLYWSRENGSSDDRRNP